MTFLTIPAANEALHAIMRSFDSGPSALTAARRRARPLFRAVPRRPSANPKSKIQSRKS
jgi:hypothetical protein